MSPIVMGVTSVTSVTKTTTSFDSSSDGQPRLVQIVQCPVRRGNSACIEKIEVLDITAS